MTHVQPLLVLGHGTNGNIQVIFGMRLDPQPTHENQKQDWPLLHWEVPLAQLQAHPSVPGGIQPEGICGFHPLA